MDASSVCTRMVGGVLQADGTILALSCTLPARQEMLPESLPVWLTVSWRTISRGNPGKRLRERRDVYLRVYDRMWTRIEYTELPERLAGLHISARQEHIHMSQQPEHPNLSLVYLTRAPQQQPAEGRRPPLLALLHGVGSNERDLFELAPELDPRFRIVSVRGPLTRGPGRYAWFDVQFLPGGGFLINPQQLNANRQRLTTFLREAVDAYGADGDRVYLMGFSQGTIMSLTLALTEPMLLAGVVAISGRIPPEVQPWMVSAEETAGLPLFVTHGREDTVIPIDWARRARETLEQQRVALTYREHDGGHFIPPATLAEVTGWLTQSLDEPRWATPGNPSHS